MTKPYDIVLFGATGYTGRLVAEVLAQQAPAAVRWAIAGRSRAKLDDVARELALPGTVARITVDARDQASIDTLVQQAEVVITTVGPYQLYGEGLVAACARHGTGYVDLCGEPAWMRQMIDRYEAQAKSSGARIVFSCGFDSIPFDLGVWCLQQQCLKQFGAPAPTVKGRVRKMKGTFSGGTAASLKATMAAAASDASVLALLKDPFSLTPGFSGPKQPSGHRPIFDELLQSWLAPFVMAPINTRNVHRSNALLGHAYGTEFSYDEMLMTGPGEKGEAMAQAVASDRSLGSDQGPKPGEGPTKAEREAGHYEVLFIGEMPSGERSAYRVSGDRDPGYGSTSKMIAQSALCLLEAGDCPSGGIWTPASAFGQLLVDRLVAHAGMQFSSHSL
jgi:short subunit dehydrogenase-like uncharacterized protein